MLLAKLALAVAFVMSANRPTPAPMVEALAAPVEAPAALSEETRAAAPVISNIGCLQIVYVWEGRIRTCAAYGPIP